MKNIWIVNDLLTAIPGTRTFWHNLVEWFGGHFFGASYDILTAAVENAIIDAVDKPDLIIRNGTYFPWFTTCHKPVISLIQDISPFSAPARELQINVGLNSDRVVFNSTFTQAHYPELIHRSIVIPLGTDFSVFKPTQAEVEFDVCWVGSSHPIKGWDTLLNMIGENKDIRFACVTKDGASYDAPNARFFSHLTTEEIVKVYNSARVGLCTSQTETQHLAGIEMAACGLPIVAPDIGIYHGVKDYELWACKVDRSKLMQHVRKLLNADISRESVRESARRHNLDLESCKRLWEDLITEVIGE